MVVGGPGIRKTQEEKSRGGRNDPRHITNGTNLWDLEASPASRSIIPYILGAYQGEVTIRKPALGHAILHM